MEKLNKGQLEWHTVINSNFAELENKSKDIEKVMDTSKTYHSNWASSVSFPMPKDGAQALFIRDAATIYLLWNNESGLNKKMIIGTDNITFTRNSSGTTITASTSTQFAASVIVIKS